MNPRLSPQAFRLLILCAALVLIASTPAGAEPPRGIGPFQLRASRDSTVAAADTSGYRLAVDRDHLLDFVAADSAAAEVEAELVHGRLSMLKFTYPGIPAPEDFATLEQGLTARFGEPVQILEPDSARRVEWQSEWVRAVLEAGFGRSTFMPMTAKFFDLDVFRAADSAAQAESPKAKPARVKRKGGGR